MPDDHADDGLFQMDRVEVPEAPKLPVEKTFRAFDPDQVLLLPPSLDDWLPAEHLARFVAELVDEHLDLSRIHAAYTEGRGAPPFDPRLMVRLLIYGYTTGVRSSRAIERRCVEDVPFRWLACGQAPDYRSIARFRKRHLSALAQLFLQALKLCQAAGDGQSGPGGVGRHECVERQGSTMTTLDSDGRASLPRDGQPVSPTSKRGTGAPHGRSSTTTRERRSST